MSGKRTKILRKEFEGSLGDKLNKKDFRGSQEYKSLWRKYKGSRHGS
jgi:hypothetical protein